MKKAQVIERGLENGHKFFWAKEESVSEKTWYSYGSCENFGEFLAQTRDEITKTYHQIILGQCSWYADLEWLNDSDELQTLEKFKQTVVITFQDTLNILINAKDIVTQTSSRGNKSSFHLNINTVGFENTATLKRFNNIFVTPRFPRPEILDKVCYAAGQSMRMAGSCKLNDPEKTPFKLLSPHTIEDTILTNRLWERVVKLSELARNPEHKERKTVKISENKINWNNRELLEKLGALLEQTGDVTSKVVKVVKPGVVQCHNQGKTRLCAFGELHRNNNFFLTVRGPDVYYQCHGTECQGKSVKIGEIGEKELSVAEFVTYNEERVRSYDVGTRVLLTSAEMGRGKSYRASEFISNLETGPKRKKLRILFIGMRIQMCLSTMKLVNGKGFVLYSQTDNPKSQDKLVIEYESLWKLKDCEGFDLVVLDEIESLLDTTTSPTNRDKMITNFETFQHIIQNCSKLIAMDADLSNKSIEFFIDECGGDQITVHRNLFRGSNRNLHFHKSKKCWRKEIADKVKQGKSIAIILGSKKEGMSIVANILEPTKYSYLFYHESTPDKLDTINFHGTMEDFKNPNVAWNKPKTAILFTPKVTTAASFDVPNIIDTIFVYGTGVSVVPRVLLQMTGRIRKPINPNLQVFVAPTKNKKAIVSRDVLKNQLEKYIRICLKLLSDEQLDEEENKLKYRSWDEVIQYKQMPTHLREVYITSQVERNKAAVNYEEELKSHAAGLGYTFSECKDTKDKRETEDKEPIPETAWTEPLISESQAALLRANDPKNPRLRRYYYQHKFKSPVSYTHYQSTRFLTEQIETVRNLLHPENTKNDLEGRYLEKGKPTYSVQRLLGELARKMGFKSATDTTTKVLTSNKSKAKSTIKQLSQLLQLPETPLTSQQQLGGRLRTIFKKAIHARLSLKTSKGISKYRIEFLPIKIGETTNTTLDIAQDMI